MNIDTKTLKEILLAGNYVTEADLASAETAIGTTKQTLVDRLVEEGLISYDLLGQAIAEDFGVPYADLNSAAISAKQVTVIPEASAKKHRIVVFKREKGIVTVTTDSPANKELPTVLKKLFPDERIKIAYSLSRDIDALFVYYQTSLDTRFSAIIEKQGRVAPELLEEIFEDAFVYKDSDIHFEPQLTDVVVRFRVDGVMKEAGRIPKEYYENILNRIKVKSGLRIDEHFSAQDGALRYEKDGLTIDMRTSIAPLVAGEKVVLRVLASYIESLTLANLGLSNEHEALLREAAEKPFGMILVAGPTGSGKTTTLYAVLKILNQPSVNITTIEDPVEYKVAGVNQIQVNAQTNLTFAKGLRSIVRQDPDTILVGEIRDEETAEIAVNAALTGHLLLSSFHANDAATVIPRLIDMGIEPFLLSSTLQVVIAQRLVRKICDGCRYSSTVKHADLATPHLRTAATFLGGKSSTLYAGKGCAICNLSGYKGRTAIFEFITISPALQDLIIRKPNAQEIWKLAREEGARSLFEDGIDKVRNGVTTLDELLRVAEPPHTK